MDEDNINKISLENLISKEKGVILGVTAGLVYSIFHEHLGIYTDIDRHIVAYSITAGYIMGGLASSIKGIIRKSKDSDK